jgi:uncharacterized protein (DUF1499 family)
MSTAVSNQKSFTRSVFSWLLRLIYRILFVGIVAMIGLYMLSFSSSKPYDLGVNNGRLAACPESPNCVSSQETSSQHQMEPVTYGDSLREALDRIKTVIAREFPRARLVTEQEDYLHYEFTSLIFRFVDDVEFFLNDSTREIHFRSASRVGHSDLGVNRRRMSKLIEELKQ